MNLGLKGKRALVLASSAGLGRAVALELAREGARVVISSRSQNRAQATADAIRSETGSETHAFEVDVASETSLRNLMAHVEEVFGGLDVLVCNAGGPPPGAFRVLDETQWEAAYHLTLMSVVRSIRLALPLLRNNNGSVLALGSSSVKRPIPNLLLSNVFRPAVHALVKHLADELAPDNLRINMLSPGRILTDRTEQLDRARAEREGRTFEQVRAESVEAIPLGRLGTPEEFARVAIFLLSDAASYMTGTSILADGGMIRCL